MWRKKKEKEKKNIFLLFFSISFDSHLGAECFASKMESRLKQFYMLMVTVIIITVNTGKLLKDNQ